MARSGLFRVKTIFILALVLAAAAGIYYWQSRAGASAKPKFKTERVDRGSIEQAISANGALTPVVLVNVGTQVSGTVKNLHADFNQRVTAGQILAELDPALFQAQLAQNQATLLNAQAALKFALAKEQRSRTLLEKGFISPTQMDEAVQALEAARAQVATAEALLQRDRTNLRYTVIRSPISGVVVARNVDLGQTVAASFQTPTLFQIAKDLREMQIDTSIAEADVGSIKVGQPVAFTVDAFLDQPFAGRVKQIRLNPTIQQNVVTYNVVVAVDNAEGRLLPGMTAHVQITVNRRDDAVRIPNAALRFKPAQADEKEKAPRRNGPTVYRQSGEQLVPLKVRTGISDNFYTELLSGDLKPGDALVTKALTKDQEKNSSSGFRMRMF